MIHPPIHYLVLNLGLGPKASSLSREAKTVFPQPLGPAPTLGIPRCSQANIERFSPGSSDFSFWLLHSTILIGNKSDLLLPMRPKL